MGNEDGTLNLVFNGEIYNFKYLREILKKKGRPFISKSNAEVIIHGYEEWKEEVLLLFFSKINILWKVSQVQEQINI